MMFSLCEWLIRRQTFEGDIQWIVVDDGITPTTCTMGQEYVRRSPNLAASIGPNNHTVGKNLLEGLKLAKYSKIVVVEDDDYYSPDYVETWARLLDSYSLVGESGAKYYRLDNNTYEHFDTGGYLTHAALARTGFRSSMVKSVMRCCEGDSAVDSRVWASRPKSSLLMGPNVSGYHVSIKRGPGRTNKKHGKSLKHADRGFNQLLTWTRGDWQAVRRYQNVFIDVLQIKTSPIDDSIALGVTSAPRNPETLPSTVESLRASGFKHIAVFREPGSSASADALQIIRPNTISRPLYPVKEGKLGVWMNYFQTMSDLLELFPNADYIGIAQDDVETCKNLPKFIAGLEWPADDCGVLSLYSPKKGEKTGLRYEDGGPFRFKKIEDPNLIGALFFVFRRDIAKELIGSSYAQSWKGMADGHIRNPRNKKAIDACIGAALRGMGLYAYFPSQSLCQHISTESTLGYGPATGYRSSGMYLGSSFDALQLLNLG